MIKLLDAKLYIKSDKSSLCKGSYPIHRKDMFLFSILLVQGQTFGEERNYSDLSSYLTLCIILIHLLTPKQFKYVYLLLIKCPPPPRTSCTISNLWVDMCNVSLYHMWRNIINFSQGCFHMFEVFDDS